MDRYLTCAAQLVMLCLASLFAACSGDPSAPPLQGRVFSVVRVSITTSGTDVDSNGYTVAVDGRSPPLHVQPNGNATFYGLAVGSHNLSVTDVEPNCVVEGSLTVVIASPADSVDTSLRITCSPLASVQVSVTTTGTDLDVSGYDIVVTGLNVSVYLGRPIATKDGSATLRLAPGRYSATLRNVAANCDGADLSRREIEVTSGRTETLEFTVTCEPATLLAFSALNTPFNSEIYAVRSDGTRLARLTDNPAEDIEPVWSPDGARIAFTSNRDGSRAIHVMNEDGSGVTRLTPPASLNYRPAWSPDGSRIAFTSTRDGNPELYVMNADGTDARRLTNHPALDTDPAWSPDGSRIAFSSERDGNAEIYVMNADGSGITRLTANATWDGHPAWPPDGSRLAFSRTQCSTGGWWPGYCYQAVFVQGPTGEPAEVGIGENPAWSRDGRKIAVTRFVCDFYYYYYSDECTLAGIGILVPLANGAPGARETWDPQLAPGQYRDPTWRP